MNSCLIDEKFVLIYCELPGYYYEYYIKKSLKKWIYVNRFVRLDSDS